MIAILFDDLYKRDRNYFFMKALNEYVQTNEACAFIVNVTTKVIPTDFAYSSISDLAHFNGTVVATSLETADAAIKCAAKQKKIFYMWEMEWYNRDFPFTRVQNILSNINVFTRSDYQAEIVNNCFNLNVKSAKISSIGDFHELC